MDGGDDMLLIGELFEEEYFFFTSSDFEDLFAFGFGDELECALGLLVGDEDFAVFRVGLLDGDGVLLDFLMEVGSLLETRLELLGGLEEVGHECGVDLIIRS